MNNREHAIILAVNAPEPESVLQEMKEVFGQERSVHVNKDLYSQSYQTARKHKDSIVVIGYSKTPKNQNLTWLSGEDPGFLECQGKSYSESVLMIMNLAFNTGAKKAVFISHLCPYCDENHISFAFEKTGEKNVVVGPAQNGRIYLIGVSSENYKFLEGLNLIKDDVFSDLAEKAKKNKLSLVSTEELPLVRDEESLRKWMESREKTDSFFLTPKNEEPPKHSPLPAETKPQEMQYHRHKKIRSKSIFDQSDKPENSSGFGFPQ